MRLITKIFELLIILATTQFALGQKAILFVNGGFTDALEKSKTENKPVFLMCYASWCPHCGNMRDKIFTDSTVAIFYNQHFICVEQDMEKNEGVTLHKKYKISSYPTFIFLDSSGIILYRMSGEFKGPELIIEGKNALTPKMQLPYLKQQFENDVSNSEKFYDYLRALKKGGMEYSEEINKYFSTQSEKQLLTETNWRIIANGIKDINSREFKFVLSHQNEYSLLASPERVERKIFFLVKELLIPLVDANDTTNYFIYRQPAATIHLLKIDSLIFNCDINLFEKNGEWNAFKNATLQSTELYEWNDYLKLKDIGSVYLKNISDSVALSKAVKWAKQSLFLHEEYSTYILCAKLYHKLNDIQGAIQMAKQGMELALKYGWDSSDADKILKDLQ